MLQWCLTALHVQVWYNVGVAASQAGDFELSAEGYRRSVALNPAAPEALSKLSLIYHKQGRVEEAESALWTAFDLVARGFLDGGEAVILTVASGQLG